MYENVHNLHILQKDGYRDQIVTSCGCVSAFQDTFTVHVAQKWLCYAHQYPSLFPVLFLYVPFNSKYISFTCLHFFYLRPANFMLIISYMYIHIHDSLQSIAALALPTNVPVLSTLVKKAWNCLGY